MKKFILSLLIGAGIVGAGVAIADIYPPHPPQAVVADIYPPHPPQTLS